MVPVLVRPTHEPSEKAPVDVFRKVPALTGIVGSVKSLIANSTAECVIGSTALMLPGRCGAEPVKSIVRRPSPVGKMVASAGRPMPLMRPSVSSAAAIVAPVFPAVMKASALPSFTSRRPMERPGESHSVRSNALAYVCRSVRSIGSCVR